MVRGMNKSQLLTELAGLLGDSTVIGDAAQVRPQLERLGLPIETMTQQ